jgi:catechol 2,3-dioxygenase-like lactoylglutathione lyase family enzyme
MAIKFKGDLTCSLGVKDLNKAIAWYKDTLGFELIYKLDEMGWCELKSPVKDVSVGLGQVEKLDVKGGATLVFGVVDIDKARDELEKKDVRFDGATQTIEGLVKLATFFDLDGNKFMLSQNLSSQ